MMRCEGMVSGVWYCFGEEKVVDAGFMDGKFILNFFLFLFLFFLKGGKNW